MPLIRNMSQHLPILRFGYVLVVLFSFTFACLCFDICPTICLFFGFAMFSVYFISLCLLAFDLIYVLVLPILWFGYVLVVLYFFMFACL